MAHASKSVHAAVIKAIKPILTVPVYDDVPPTSPQKFVTVSMGTEMPADAKDISGQDITIEVHQWDSVSRNRSGVLDLQNAIYNTVHNASLAVDGFSLTYIWFEFSTSFLDEDGLTMHGVMRFRVRTLG